MSGLLNDIQRIICDMASDKPTARNKALELLDQKLNSSRDALHAKLTANEDLSWTQLFHAVNQSIIKHTNNLQDAREKSYKSLSDKCYLYGNVLDKIVDYNLEIGRGKSGHFLAKSTIFDAFENGVKQRMVVRHFGDHILNMLDRGIYLSSTYVCDLKVSEYSRTLSYLFELNIDNDEFLRLKILKCITKTVELAQKRVQLHADIADYLPALSSYSQNECNSDRRVEIVRLYHLFLNELSVNYHHKLCVHMQEILPNLCDFHNADTFRDDMKNILFECIILSLHALYPKLNKQDFNTFQVPIHESWPQTMQKLKTIIDMELRKQSIGRNKLAQVLSDAFAENFLKMSALIMYIRLWHFNTSSESDTPSKRKRIEQLDCIITLIDKKETSFNDIWFAIFAKLLQLSNSIINAANYQQTLQITLDVLLIYGNGKNLQHIRQCLTSILSKEQELLKTESIPVNYLASQWLQIAAHLISDSRPNGDIILEKQLILQALIRHNKLSPNHCATLLLSIQNNELLRRNECLTTIRDIFINADRCGLKKASVEMEPIITWAYTSGKSNATQIIHNIPPIEAQLLADTFSIGIINFLDEQQLQQLVSESQTSIRNDSDLQLLNFKYNKQLVCLSEEFQSKLRLQHTKHSSSCSYAEPETKNCLFQNNYELLMRLLNLEASNEHTTPAMIMNLRCLYKLICTMERLLHYKVFDANNLAMCPLIKRIGLFLSHIEFQYKANQPESISGNGWRDVLGKQIAVLDVFNSNEVLSEYLEKQPIEMLLEFIGSLLKHSYSQCDPIEAADRTIMAKYSLHILGQLCANSTYRTEAFQHISRDIKNARHQFREVLMVTKMLCRCKSLESDSITWLVDKLKVIFQHHYTNMELISELVEYMPTIFYFVNQMEQLLFDMMLAMISLLKLALRKSYSTKLAVKIVNCVAEIVRRCPNIFELENFAVICMAVAKFLSMPTLEVRLAAISTLSLLLNTDYCVPENEENAVEKSEKHLEFCKQLYDSIEWSKFLFIIGDLEQNSNAVVIQTFVAFFAFSSFHQEVVLKRLLEYIVSRKLTETDFCALGAKVPGYGLTMRQLMKPYADVMLNQWKSAQWSTNKFPFYLFYNSNEEFLKEHAKSIMAYTYIYGKPEDIPLCGKNIKDEQCLKLLTAYSMISLSRCAETQVDEFKRHHENLQQNLAEFEIQLSDVPLNAMTLYYTIRLLLDDEEFARLFGSSVQCNRCSDWYNISVETLFKSMCLHVSGKNWSRNKRIQTMSVLMFEQPLILIDVLTILKIDCYEAVLPSHVLHSFFLYCTIADAMLDAIKDFEATTDANASLRYISCPYFVRDIWFFVCRLLLHTKCRQLQQAGLKFLQIMQAKQSFVNHNNPRCLMELAKVLMSLSQHMETQQLKEQAAAELKPFITQHRNQLNLQELLEENTECECLQELICTEMPNVVDLGVADYIKAFLKPNRLDGRLHGLREYIAEHKIQLQQHDELLFQLINRLLRMVRESTNEESSMDALKTLAEIGPIKMQNNSYYFQTDFDVSDESEGEPMDQFIRTVMEALNNQLFNFNPRTQQALVQVIGHVVNSKSGSKLHDLCPNLGIFHQRCKKSGFLNSLEGIPAIDWLAALNSCDGLEFEPWMCAFMAQVFHACGWHGFSEFAANSFTFSQTCLQPFVKLLLANKEVHLPGLCSMLDHFFAGYCGAMQGIYQEKRAIKRFLYMCECIRLTNNWIIPINLSNVIMASNHCQAYFLSIMYLELWGCETNNTPDVDILEDDNFQKAAKKAYESIGCLDAMSGFLNPLRSRVDYLSLNNNLFACWLESDNLDIPNSELSFNIMKSNGMLSLANLQQRCRSTKEMDFEIFWRLGQWDELVEIQQPKLLSSRNMELEFNKQHYLALKSISHREDENTVSAINNAYHCVKAVLRDISVECLQSVYKYMTWLCTLQQAEDFAQIQFSTQLSTTQINEIFNKWQTELNLNYGNFNCKEHILSHQIALFKIAGTRANRRIQQYYKHSPVDTYLLKCIGVCRDAGKLNMATKYISKLRGLPNIKEATKISAMLEDADVQVKTGNYQIAKATLQHVVSNSEFQYCLQRVPALRMQGEFLLNCNAQNLSYVLEHNFNKSIKLLDQFEKHKTALMTKYPDIFAWSTFGEFENDNRKAAHAAIAKYADREYQRLHDYRNSQEYKMIADIIQQNRELADSVTQREKPDRDRRVGAINLSRFAKHDEAELQKIEDNLTEHLCTAVEHYIAYCQLDGGFSSAEIYRIIALWFTNDENEQMLRKISDLIANVPSYKFICALNQMVGRLTSKNAKFHKLLVEVLVRCGQDHPQHTFYKLYPLVYAFMDGNHSNTQRADIAKKIIAQICEGNPKVATCNKQFDTLFPALIGFANTYLVIEPNGRPSTKGVPDKLKQLNKLMIDAIHCPTLSLSVQPSQNYNIISMVKWTNDFTLCGGLNAPIKLSCLCSDGVVRAQLIKGKDDMRQDAVMQQVFGIVNELLNSDSEFIERKLQLRTYKVTPLSMRSGILEWCSNTIPVAAYLVGDNTSGAHMRYHPKGWNNRKCREMSMAALRKSDSIRKAVYDKICENVKPVFHYFFLEKYAIPGVWFERRLAYINSVATTSMVGYVLGLGDRHTQNILIDEQTGEVIHIDFGIAFEQGKIQATKETVPFRLTRDFVSPMGFCGTNGVFTKSCEAIMHILRRYKLVFTTILEVLLYDPLFIWGVLSKDKTRESTKESKNLLAQRALLLVQHKLEGREHGVLDNTNVETQVQRLINEATLPSNLALLYPGWDPYL